MPFRIVRLTLSIFTFLILSSGSSEAGTATLTWDRPDDSTIVGYVIRYGTAPGSYTETVDVGNVATYRVDNLDDGGRFYFVVQSYDQAGRFSPASNEVVGVIGSAAPSDLSGTVSGSTIDLTWYSPGGEVTGYRVEVGTAASGPAGTA